MNVTVQEDIIGRSLRVSIWHRSEDGRTAVWGPDGMVHFVDEQPPGIALPDEWLWRIPGEAVAPLTQALKARQGDVVDEVVRRDFEREQARVDLFIAHLTGGAS
jgi:hypothetical protein